MLKIISSFLVVVTLAGVVAGATFAVYSDTAKVDGVTLSTGNADLKVSLDNSTYLDNWPVNMTLDGLYPGYTNNFDAWFENVSLSNIPLSLSIQLTEATGDWDALKDVIHVRIADLTNTNVLDKTLAELNASSLGFGPTILHSAPGTYFTVTIYVPSTFGNEIAGKTISNVTFLVTGTQV